MTIKTPRSFAFLQSVLFGQPSITARRRLQFHVMTVCFFIGIAHWLVFLSPQSQPFYFYDWPKENIYLDTLRTALTTLSLPWEWADAYYPVSPLFLANPESILTPDILLLAWLNNGLFITLHVLFFYTAGFVGTIHITRKYNLSLTATIFFWLVFNFNGYITAHLAVGHLQWAGYFLLPFFISILTDIVRTESPPQQQKQNPTISMIFLFGILLLNGSFHIVIWCMLMLACALIAQPSLIGKVATVIFGSLGLGLGRLLPAALFFEQDKAFMTGYPNLTTLLDAFTSLQEHDHLRMGGLFGNVYWAEYDVYIGFVAFLAIGIGFAFAIGQNKILSTSIMTAASLVFLFSLGNVFASIAKLPLPFVGVERIPTRFIILPFLVVLLTATRGLDELLQKGSGRKLFAVITLFFIAWELALHSYIWALPYISASVESEFQANLIVLKEPGNDWYAISVGAGWVVSILSSAWLILSGKKHLSYE